MNPQLWAPENILPLEAPAQTVSIRRYPCKSRHFSACLQAAKGA